MNQYAVKSEDGKLYGPFKTGNAAAKWANVHLRRPWNRPENWAIVRIFKPRGALTSTPYTEDAC